MFEIVLLERIVVRTNEPTSKFNHRIESMTCKVINTYCVNSIPRIGEILSLEEATENYRVLEVIYKDSQIFLEVERYVSTRTFELPGGLTFDENWPLVCDLPKE